MKLIKNKAEVRCRSNYQEVIEHSVFPISLVITIIGPALLLAIQTGGFIPFALLMASDVISAAIGAFLFLRFSKSGLIELSIKPVALREPSLPLRKAA
jgi:hypothetical protein